MNTKDRSWRRARVLAAAGLVLGLGSFATVASFQDSTWANGQFKFDAARGGIEGATDSTNGTDGAWDNHFTTDAAAVMTVNPSANPNLTPGKTVYSKFSLRSSKGVTTPTAVTMAAGVVTRNGGSTPAMVNAVRVRAYSSPNHSCGQATAGQTGGVSYFLGNATPGFVAAGSTPTNTSIILPAGTTGAAGLGRTICFEFSLANGVSSDAANGADFSVTWPFTTTIGT